MVPLLLLAACGDGSGKRADPLGAVGVRLSTGVETVVIVEWELDESADEVWVEYGADDGYGRVAPAWTTSGETGSAILLGLRADTEVHLRLAARSGEETRYGDDRRITTGALPPGVEGATVEADAGDDFGDWFVTSTWDQASAETFVAILDREGEVVWYTDPVPGTILAARASRDGRSVVYQVTDGPFATEEAEICRASLDGESTTCFGTPMGHHDFLELEGDRWAWIRAETRAWEGYDLIGDALVEQEADGTVTEVWNAFDWITPEPNATWEQLQTPDGVDWTHTNGLWLDASTGAYYLTFLHLEMMHEVADGATRWVLGGPGSDFEISGERFGPLHAPMAVPGGVMVFDNADRDAGSSRVLAYALDEGAMTATNTLERAHPDGRQNHTLGDAVLLDGDYVLGAFGESGDVMVWDPSGAIAWRARMAGVACQFEVHDDLYAMGR